VGMLLGAAVLLGLFVVVEGRSAAPLVPLRIFRSRSFVGGNLAMTLIGMTAWGMGITVSAYAQDVLDYSPLRFGLGQTTMTAMTIAGSYAAQAGISKVGIRPVAAVAIALMGTGTLLLTQVSADGSYFGDLFLGLLIFGPGLGGGAVAATSAALTSVDDQDAGVASGTNTAAFQIGGALGTAVVSSVVISQVGASTQPTVLTDGFQAGFVTNVIFAVIGLCVVLTLLRPRRRPA
jgi:hypothetical protein